MPEQFCELLWKLIEPKERVIGTPQIYVYWRQKEEGDNLDSPSDPMWGSSLRGTEPQLCGSDALSRQKVGLSSRVGPQPTALAVGRKTHMHNQPENAGVQSEKTNSEKHREGKGFSKLTISTWNKGQSLHRLC